MFLKNYNSVGNKMLKSQAVEVQYQTGRRDTQAKQPRLSSIEFEIKIFCIALQSRLCSTFLLLKIFCQMSPFISNEVINPDHTKWLIIQKRDRHSGITSIGHL